MDRAREQSFFNQSAMPIIGTASINLLLPASSFRTSRIAAEKTYRRDIYYVPVLRFQKDCSRTSKRRLGGQSKKGSEGDAGAGIGRNSARSIHVQKPSRPYQVSLSFTGSTDRKAYAGMEHRYHLYSFATGFYIPHGNHRLGQSISPFKSAIQQSGRVILRGGPRRGRWAIWLPRNTEYRSGSAIYLPEVCRLDCQSRNSLQHGWKREGIGQGVCCILHLWYTVKY